MAITITDTKTNKTYQFNSRFIPTTSITSECQDGWHGQCTHAPQHLIKYFDIEFTKKICCLCTCHHDKEVN